MKLAVSLLLLAACDANKVEMYPVHPGGGGGGGTTYVDAAVDAGGDASPTIVGRVCLANDPRDPLACADTGANGLTVTLGSETTTTAANGDFTITRPATTTNAVWFVTGDAIEPSAMQFGDTATIPAIGTSIYSEMVAAMETVPLEANGALIARLWRNGTPLTGVSVNVVPPPDSLVFFDGFSFDQWDSNVTGSFGVVWVPSAAPGTVDLTVIEGSAQADVTGIPIYANTITFYVAEIP